jgi:large subunit ribosomal protein L20
MPRSTNSVASRKRRKRILKKTKGYFGRRKNVWTVAKNAYEKAKKYAYRDRRRKKRDFRSLWIQRIGAAVRMNGFSYSKFIDKLHKQDITVNRKEMAYLAMKDYDQFKKLYIDKVA